MLNELRGGVMRLAGIPSPAQHMEIPELTITGTSGFQSVNLQPGGWFQTNLNSRTPLDPDPATPSGSPAAKSMSSTPCGPPTS
jgi:hypothetical protein